MVNSAIIYGQQSLDFFGSSQSGLNSKFRLNSFESNPSNFTASKDWEFSAAFSGVSASAIKTNLFSVSLGKRFGDHYLFARYTPGMVLDFIFNSGVKIISKVEITPQNKIHFDEQFGLGYSFRFSPALSGGLSLRYFRQEFQEEQPEPFFSDTLNYIKTTTTISTANFWRGDLGLTYLPCENLSLSLSSINLFVLGENPSAAIDNSYSLRKDKGAIVGIKYQPSTAFGFQFSYETNNSFLAGINIAKNIFGEKFTIGFSAFHDRYQNPFIAGILPVINYSSNLYSVTLSGIKYFSDRSAAQPLSVLRDKGINNLINTPFTTDRVMLSVNFAFSFVHEQLVKFIDVRIPEEIFPTLADKYFIEPFATARVVNVSDKKVMIRPSSIIKNINKEVVYSPSINISAGDTVDVPFYTIIGNSEQQSFKREITQAIFYLNSTNSESDDKLEKPILVNDSNSWDGRVSHLKYFVQRDFDYSSRYSKNVFQANKERIEKNGTDLEIFEKVKILFDGFVKNMVYVSDPRGSVEHVQFPNETISLKGGDCDDLSVCFSSLLESVGIQTAFVDYKKEDGVSHVNLLINTQLRPEQISLITNNDKKILIRKSEQGKDEVWIPLETTSLTNFDTAWSLASDKFNSDAIEHLGLAKNKVQIIDIN